MSLLSANLAGGLETMETWQLDVPVKAANTIYEGAPVICAAGTGVGRSPDGTTNIIAQGDVFVGYCLEKVANTAAGAADGDKKARVQTRGIVKLQFSSVALTDVGSPAYVNATTTDSLATQTPDNTSTEFCIGTIVGYIDSTHAYVFLDGVPRVAGQTVSNVGKNTNVGWHHVKVLKLTYDFAVLGGAVSTISFPATIPNNTRIIGAMIDIRTTLTSGGSATIALQVEAANDVKTATAVASWAAGDLAPAAGVTFGTATVKTTAARTPKVVIGTAALTAGVFDLYLFCVNC